MPGNIKTSVEHLEQGAEDAKSGKYVLRLFVTGLTLRSTRAIENIRKICTEHLPGRYELDVVDVYQQPMLARDEQILAAPTLLKKLPLPVRRMIGDMSDTEKILRGLNINPVILEKAN